MVRLYILSCIVAALVGTSASAQQTIEGYPRVVVEDSARQFLIASWESDDPYSPERVYCAHVRVLQHKISKQLMYLVDRIRANIVDSATQYRAVYRSCGEEEITIHTHTPATCTKIPLMIGGFNSAVILCQRGGWDAYDCEPSIVDYNTLFKIGHAFAGVECAAGAIRWFYNPSHNLNHAQRQHLAYSDYR